MPNRNFSNKVLVSITNYNNPEDTIACIESLVKSNNELYFIVLIDNYSTDNSHSIISGWLKKKNTNQSIDLSHKFRNFNKILINRGSLQDTILIDSIVIFYIKSNKNNGFAYATNIAFDICTNFHCKGVWLLNNDCIVTNDSLNKLINVTFNRLCMVGSLIKYRHNGDINSFGAKKILSVYRINKNNINRKILKVDALHGASMFVPLAIIQDIGHMDEKYFLYLEETDYCVTANKKGFPCYVNSESIVYHKEGASTGKSIEKDVLIMANYCYFAKKNLNTKEIIPSILYILAKIFYLIIKNRSFKIPYSVYKLYSSKVAK